MDVHDLRCFLRLADDLNFTRAAEALNIVQPALSRRIQNLERELDARLFDRSSRNVSLTDLGHALVPHARLILANMDMAMSVVHNETQMLSGSVRVGAANSLASTLLPEILRQFHQEYPLVRLDVTERRTPELISAVEEGQLDMALIFGPHRQTSLRSYVLHMSPLLVVMPEKHPAADAERIGLEMFTNDRFIYLSEPGEPYSQQLDDLFLRAGFIPDVVCTGVNAQTAVEFVSHGLGVTVLSSVNEPFISRKGVISRPLPLPDAVSSMVLIERLRQDLRPAARLLRDQILQQASLGVER